MFGLGMGEILVIAVVALLVLGPERLPAAAKTLSKGIRDLRRQGRELREVIDVDTEVGGAFRDLNSALRGELPVDDEPAPTVAEQPSPQDDIDVVTTTDVTDTDIADTRVRVPDTDVSDANDGDTDEGDTDVVDSSGETSNPEIIPTPSTDAEPYSPQLKDVASEPDPNV